jgi:hypothetical protein
MTHYQKLATLLFRVIGSALLTIGIFMGIFALGTGLASDPRVGIIVGSLYSLPCLIFGAAFFFLSRKLAQWVCFDFEKGEEEQPQKDAKES